MQKEIISCLRSEKKILESAFKQYYKKGCVIDDCLIDPSLSSNKNFIDIHLFVIEDSLKRNKNNLLEIKERLNIICEIFLLRFTVKK